MYRAAVSRSVFLSLFASTATWRRSRSASARPLSESGGSGPVWERTGIAIMYRIPAAKSRPRMTSAVKKAMVLLECVLQLGEEVVNALDADRQAHQALVDAELGAHVLGQRGVSHDRRVLDQALDAAKALGESEEFAALEEPPGSLQPALKHSRHHAAVAAVHLPGGKRVLRMAREPGINDALDAGMLFEPLRDLHRVLAMTFHPQCQRFDAAQGEEGVERARHAAQRVLQEAQFLFQSAVSLDDGGAADHVGMAVQVLRRRVHDDVEAVLERTLEVGRGEGVVAHREQAALARDRRHRLQVDELKKGIGRAFDPDHAGVRSDRLFQLFDPGQIHEARLQPGAALPHFFKDPVAAAV